ncbi:hypothetical protein [Ruminococcus flavefaciens]|uniref:Uncharacterized protein n=1 Tax=Ruminococcus flavefaciens TaxID=1265 RepID=A0A315XZU3_RUMFL|nr:hypothetical protein [Ruminococcus flavefaciens]PWJ12254.1 hypothetical protein IE37_01944 [Ruminococcus flavefaciens]SSA49744.1 hypothetical protein SAMN02910325_01944 [Ruminococcus flavefaciens]
MDILDELAEKFALTLDSQLCNNSDYLKATAMLNELVREFPIKKATEIEDIAADLTAAAFNTGIRSGLKLGARIAIGLIGSDK